MAVSIKDVARMAGVAPSTVSRALGKGPVSDEVRAQVQAAVLATGYRPNLSARRLRSRHTMTVGLILADIRNPFFTAVSQAVEDAAYRAGMRVILCNTDEDPVREAMYLGLMEEERVSGVILAPHAGMSENLPADPGFPLVLLDRASAVLRHDSVTIDNEGAARLLVDHLVEQGYRRIGGLFGATSSTGRERRAGFHGAMERHGLVPASRLAPPSRAAGRLALEAWLTEAGRPEALVLSNGLFVEGAVIAARTLGLSLPGDLAIAGFDDESWAELLDPAITVIRQPVETIGREAMRLLLARLETPELPVRKVVLSGQRIVRASTPRRGPTLLAEPG